MPDYTLSTFAYNLELLGKWKGLYSLYHTMNNSHVILSEGDGRRLLDGSCSKLDPPVLELLIENDILVKEGTDELSIYKALKQKYVHGFDAIGSKILVTRKCNNRCSYCFLMEEQKDMSEDTALAVSTFYIDFIKRKNTRKVRDVFIGGEPFLKKDIMLSIATRLYYYCLGKEIDYGFRATTNGTLLDPADISRMLKVGLAGLNVSMGGHRASHDRIRPAKDGPTYDRIMQNLASISGQVPITIECQYDPDSDDYLHYPAMLDDLIRHEIEIERIVYSPILPTQRDKGPFKPSIGDPQKRLYLIRETLSRGIQVEDGPPSGSCSAEYLSSFVFDVDGGLLPCPSLQNGQLAYGNVINGIDWVSQTQIISRELPKKCINGCVFLPLCNGGCRNQALVRENDFWCVDCNYEGFKVLLEDYIRRKSEETLDQNPPEISGKSE